MFAQEMEAKFYGSNKCDHGHTSSTYRGMSYIYRVRHGFDTTPTVGRHNANNK